MFKRTFALALCMLMLLSVQCSALNITKVVVTNPKSPISERDKNFTITTDEYIGYNTLIFAFYSDNGRFLGMKEFYALDDNESSPYPDETEPFINYEAPQLPCRVRIFIWSGNDGSALSSARPVSNVYETRIIGLNEMFERDLPDFLTDLRSGNGRATFQTDDEKKIRNILETVGNSILDEIDGPEMTKSYLQTRYKTEIAEVKEILNAMTSSEQSSFNSRMSAFTDKYEELRMYLLQIFGLI